MITEKRWTLTRAGEALSYAEVIDAKAYHHIKRFHFPTLCSLSGTFSEWKQLLLQGLFRN